MTRCANRALELVAATLSVMGMVAVGLVGPRLFSPSPGRPPSLLIVSERVEAKIDPVQGVAHATFHIANHGDRRLIVNAYDVDCECRQPLTETLSVRPREIATLTIPFPIGADGENRFELATSDPVRPSVTVTAWRRDP